jgi:hypothetical protein
MAGKEVIPLAPVASLERIQLRKAGTEGIRFVRKLTDCKPHLDLPCGPDL